VIWKELKSLEKEREEINKKVDDFLSELDY